MKKLKLTFLTLALGVSLMACAQAISTQPIPEQLEKAKAEGQTVFMIVTDANTSAEKLMAIVRDAANTAGKVAVVEMKVDDPKNADLVTEYRLNGAPMPLVMVFANSGALMGGMVEEQVTKDALLDAIPTPKYGEIINSLGQGKPVMILLSNSSFNNDSQAVKLCEAAKNEMGGNAEVVTVDPNDSNENKLITMLNIKNTLTDSYIVAINGQGMMSGRFETLPSQKELVDAAQMVMQSGCAPGGCGPTCN